MRRSLSLGPVPSFSFWLASSLAIAAWGTSSALAGATPTHQPAPRISMRSTDDAKDTAGVVVVAEDGVERISQTSGRYNFPEVDPLKSRSLEHIFLIRNTSEKPVTLSHVQGSCGCSRVTLLPDGAATTEVSDQGRTLKPGETARIQVVVDIAKITRGASKKYVWIFAAGQTMPIATVEMNLNVSPVVKSEPLQVNFGRAAFGSEREVTFTISVDRRLYAEKGRTLISTNPDVTATLKGAVKIPAPDSPSDVSLVENWVRLTYTLTLSKSAPLGPVMGTLYWGLPETASAQGSLPATMDPHTAVVVPISGEIIGSISALPAAAVFGMVTEGSELERSVRIFANTPDTFKGLKIVSQSPFISATLEPEKTDTPATAAAPAGATAGRIRITLAKSAPAGELVGEVHVLTASGERLVVTVLAYVQKPGATDAH